MSTQPRSDLKSTAPTRVSRNGDDEHAGENEAPVRAVDEGTETPEEFEVDDQDKLAASER